VISKFNDDGSGVREEEVTFSLLIHVYMKMNNSKTELVKKKALSKTNSRLLFDKIS